MSHDFLRIKWLWSVSIVTSMWLCPTDGLNPGGVGKSLFRFLCTENGKKTWRTIKKLTSIRKTYTFLLITIQWNKQIHFDFYLVLKSSAHLNFLFPDFDDIFFSFSLTLKTKQKPLSQCNSTKIRSKLFFIIEYERAPFCSYTRICKRKKSTTK